MSSALINDAEGPGSLALPQLTPHSFASLRDAFCAALKAVSTLLKVVEELYAICQSQQQRLEESHMLSTPGLPAGCRVLPEQQKQEGKQDEQSSCAVSQAKDNDHRKVLCRLETVLQAARSLNCNAEQYDHLITAGLPAYQSAQSPCSEAFPATLRKDSRSSPHAETHTGEKQEMRAAGTGAQRHSIPQASSDELLHIRSPSSRSTSRGSTARDKDGSTRESETGVAPETFARVKRGYHSRCGSTVSSDYELSVCKALLMLQQLDLHEENVCSEEESFFTLEHRQTRQQPTVSHTQNYARPALQREAFYDVVQKEVQERQAPVFRHDLQNSWQYTAEDSCLHQQLHRRLPLSLQTVLAGGPSIKLDKTVILEMLLRVKVLQETQRMLRADIIMLRHQHLIDGQTLLLTLQKTVTKHGLERKALLFRLQKLASLLQNR